jgi:hypothetical protein
LLNTMIQKHCEPRESLAETLSGVGIDSQTAFLIALDAGLGVVDKEYLVDAGLKGYCLKAAEELIMKFYWEEEAFCKEPAE